MGSRPVSSNGHEPDQVSAPVEGSSVVGLARELEQLYREVRELCRVSQRVDELAATLAQFAETIAPGPSQHPVESALCWLDHPADLGHDPAHSHATHDAELLLGELASWVAAVYLRYSDAGSGLPDCWMRHPDVVEELLWLHQAWVAAYARGAHSTAVGDWHDRQRPGVVTRVRGYAGSCSLDAHKPGHEQHGPLPSRVPADPVEVIARWWTTDRGQAAPAPTEEQLAAALERHRRARR
jgi:hypothetical protein